MEMNIDEQIDIIAKLEMIATGGIDINTKFYDDIERDIQLSKTTLTATFLAKALQYQLEIVWDIPRPMVKDRIAEIDDSYRE